MRYDMNAGKTAEQRFEDTSFELAILRLLQKENERLQETTDEGTQNEIKAAAEKNISARLQMIEKKAGRNSYWKAATGMIKKTAFVILVCLLIINMLFSVTLAASRTVRMKALEFFSSSNESEIRLGYQEIEQDIDVPADWENRYYPAYVPAGYEVSLYLPGINYSTLEYSNAQGETISVEICTANDSYSINMEKATLDTVPLHNTTATVISQEYGKTDIFWTTGDVFFVVGGNDKEAIMQVAEGIVLLEK